MKGSEQMRDIRALLITLLGVIIFIALLPTLLWLLAIVFVIFIIFLIYSRVKYRRMFRDATMFEEEEYTNTRQRNIDPDVIDVEYTQKDEDEV